MPVRVLALLLSLICADLIAEDSAAVIPEKLAATAAMLMDKAIDDPTGYQIIESLTTEIGPRLPGSAAEKRARAWAVDKLKALGFQNVAVETFEIPFWQRGTERAEILSPFPQPLTVTALGGSTSTGAKGVEGEVVSFPSLAALAAQPDKSLTGKIVFVDEMMTRTQDGSGYSLAAKKRRETAYEAHRLGARAALIRSVGTSSHRFPHTGQMHRATGEIVPSVPTGALASPDADQLARALSRGRAVVLRLVLETQSGSTATSGNVIAEIPGRERPEEIVVLGAHLDSWDLGTGAIDDAAGVGIVVGAAKLIMDSLAQAPRRTIRIVLFGSEEVGLLGARAYAEQHAQELENHIIGTESDFGAGKIWRFDTGVGGEKLAIASAIAEVLRPLGIAQGPADARGGPDMKYIREAGVPVVDLVQNGWDYFNLHHTPDDTFDKVDPQDIAQNVAAYAAFAFLAAELEVDFR
jgi:carboxypeptidase Q